MLLLADTLLLYQQAYCCFGSAVAALLFQLSEQAFSSTIASQPVAGIHSRCGSCWLNLCNCTLPLCCLACVAVVMHICWLPVHPARLRCSSFAPAQCARHLLVWTVPAGVCHLPCYGCYCWCSGSQLAVCFCPACVELCMACAGRLPSQHHCMLHSCYRPSVWTCSCPQCGLAAAQQATAHLVRLHVCARGGVFAVWSLHLPDHSRACNKSAMHAVRCSNRWGCAVLCAAYIPLMCAGALCMTCCCSGDHSAGACAAAVPAVHADACCQR